MRILIAGSGRVGRELAQTLAEQGHDVSVIDNQAQALEALGSTFNGTVHRGLAYDVSTLREAGIEFADVFVAVTDSDNANLMAVQVAKEVFMVPRSIARLDAPAREDAYRALDIQYVPFSKIVSKVIYEQIIEEEFSFHVPFTDSDVEIVEMALGEGADHLTVGELEVEDRLRVAAVRRNGRTFIPGVGFALRPGDLVVAAAREGVSAKVQRFLETPEHAP